MLHNELCSNWISLCNAIPLCTHQHFKNISPPQLLHGFDDTGRLYAPDGAKRVWWPAGVRAHFDERARCFVRQYSTEVFSGRSVDGRRTLSENIADNGGLMAAYGGYKAWYVMCFYSRQHYE